MKKAFALLTVSLLLGFGVSTVRAEERPVANKVGEIKAGKEEGTVDKEFFKKIMAEKPSNVSIVDVRTLFEYQAGHIEGSQHIFINDLFNKGCDPTLGRLPKEGYVVFVCATGARAGEMYFGIVDDCKSKDTKRLFFLDANVEYRPNGPVVQ
jgi:hydroxyacylglutathione hydrolase